MCVSRTSPRMHGSRRRLGQQLDGVCMIAPRVIACSRDIIVQGRQRAIAEVAAIIDSQPCGQPLCSVTEPTCWITGLRFITVVRELGWAKFRAHRERALSSTTHDFAFLHVRARRRMILERVKGSKVWRCS